MDTISIRGARTHNLKNIDIDIDLPRDKLIVITGLYGSSNLLFIFTLIKTFLSDFSFEKL
jgi:excinuclease ABC subunit A